MGPEFYTQTANFLHSLTQVLTTLQKWREGLEIAHLAMYVLTFVPIQEDSCNWALMLSMMGRFFRILEVPNATLFHHLQTKIKNLAGTRNQEHTHA
jgi:hypothetical protein